MVILYILGGLLLLILGLLCISPTVYVTIREEVSVYVGALGIKKQISLKGSKEKPEKKKQPAKKKTKGSPQKTNDKSFGDTVSTILDLIRAILPPTGRLLRKVRFTHMSVRVSVGCEDASQTAIRFGQFSTGIYNVLGTISHLCTLRVKEVSIFPDFIRDETQYDISFRVKLRLFVVLWAGFCMLWRFLMYTLKGKKNTVAESPKKEKAVQ